MAVEQCCAIRQSQLTMEREALRVAARKAATADAKNRPMERYLAAVEAAKQQVATQVEAMRDHEAYHAGVPA